MKGRGRKSLFYNHKLTFTRNSSTYLGDNYKLVQVPGEEFLVLCDIQPYTVRPDQQNDNPEGYSLKGAKWLSTKTKLNTIEESSATPPDTTVIDGREFYVWKVLDYRGSFMEVDKMIEYALLRKALPNDKQV